MYRKEGERTWPDFPVDLSLSLSARGEREVIHSSTTRISNSHFSCCSSSGRRRRPRRTANSSSFWNATRAPSAPSSPLHSFFYFFHSNANIEPLSQKEQQRRRDVPSSSPFPLATLQSPFFFLLSYRFGTNFLSLFLSLFFLSFFCRKR